MKNKFASLGILGALILALSGCGAAAGTDDSNGASDSKIDAVVTVSEDDTSVISDENEDASDEKGDTSNDEALEAEASDDTQSSSDSYNEVKRPEFKIELEDGTYMVDFDTDSSMFHVNEAMDGKARLTVKNNSAILFLTMPSKNVLKLYEGSAEAAADDEAGWILPVTELVTYDDGITEEVYGYYVPVYVMDEEFELALIGKKEIWYDHKVSISNPEAVDNDYSTIAVSLEGGTGRAYIESPAKLRNSDAGYIVTLVWSSKYYDYMIVDGEKYLPVFVEEHSVFEIPVTDLSTPLNVIADTIAMSEPHEVEYIITFDEASIY